MRRHAGVNRVGQNHIVLVIRLDNRRRMHARGGAKRIVADNRIVRRNGHARGPRHRLAIMFQLGEILLRPRRNAHQLQIHQHLIDLRIAHALSQSNRAPMNAICPGDHAAMELAMARPRSLCPCQSTRIFSPQGFTTSSITNRTSAKRAHGRSVPGGVTNHDGARTTSNRRRVEPLHRLRIAAAGIFSDVHRVQAERNRILHGFLGGLQKKIVAPAFRKAANGTGADKCSRLDAQAGFLHDLGNGTNIVLMRPRRAVGANLHLVRDDFPRQRRHVLDRARSCTRQSEIKRVDPERLHQMEDLNFLGDRRVAHGRRLQAIAQALIVQQNRPRRLQSRRMILVPVVDEFGGVHGQYCQYRVPS